MTARITTFFGGHRGMGCTDHQFYQDKRDIASLPVENTLDSIKAAYNAGADYVEVDAVMTGDKKLIITHIVDPSAHFFDQDRPVAMLNKMSFSDIQHLRTGRLNQGKIATFLETLNLAKSLDPSTAPWCINIELKDSQDAGQGYDHSYIDTVVQETIASGFPLERILWTSFCLHNIIKISHFFPQSKYGMIFHELSSILPLYSNYQDNMLFQFTPYTANVVDQIIDTWEHNAHPNAVLGHINPEINFVDASIVQKAKQFDLCVNMWGFMEDLNKQRLQQYYAAIQTFRKHKIHHSIITDYLPEMLQTFRQGVG